MPLTEPSLPNLPEGTGHIRRQEPANQAQGDGTFKAIATLFAEEGIDNLSPAPENNELLGMERILSHWMNLDQREPTLKILCPKALQDIAKPNYGIVNGGCQTWCRNCVGLVARSYQQPS